MILALFASKNEIWHGKTDIITTYNLHLPNIDAISDALITMSLSILILRSKCDEGARDSIDIWYVGIICLIEKNISSFPRDPGDFFGFLFVRLNGR